MARLCRAPAARLLVTIALACPGAALPTVSTLLREHGSDYDCREVPVWLLEGYETVAPLVGRALAADLADSLAGLPLESTDSTPALELLTRLLADHAALRKSVSKRVAKLLEDRESADSALRPALDALAGALEQGGRTEESSTHEMDLGRLDGAVLMADGPLKTLSEYAAFMKALSRSADPLAVMAAYGMTQETFVACVARWGEALASNDRLALRYSQLVQEGHSE